MKTEEITITPAMAAEMLKHNTGNRPLSDKIVKHYAEEMTSGRWKMNGDTIKRNCDGRILDGQHRLQAVILSGIPLRAVVISGLSEDIFDTLDIGKRRTGADTVHIMGMKYGSNVAAALNIVHFYVTGRPNQMQRAKTRNTLIQQLVQEHPGIENSAAYASNCEGSSLMPPAWLTAFHYLASKIDREMADTFIADVKSGRDLRADDPVFVLRERLVKNLASKAKLDYRHLFALMIKAWNARRSGQRLHVLRFSTEGQNTEDFPTLR